jgi:integrase/recombinase XerD
MSIEEYLKESLSPQSAKSYLYEINKFILLNKETQHYNYPKVMEYVEMLRINYPPNTLRRIVFAIKKYYDYLIEIKVRDDNPARSIKLRDAKENPIQLQDLLTDKELQSLLLPRKERYPFLAKRNEIIMSLLVNQALKVSEIGSLKITDINLEKAEIKVTGTRQTNNRNLPLQASQILLFYQYINEYRIKIKTNREDKNAFLLGKLGTPITGEDIGYLISTYQNQFKKKLTTTSIRQSVITNLLNKNNDLRKVQYFAGHKHADTTEKYRQTGLNALQTAIEKLHPIK